MNGKVIKTYENYNFDVDGLNLGRFDSKIIKKLLSMNEDGTFDYKGHLDFSDMKIFSLSGIPIRFKNVLGDFKCNDNYLVSLEGAPEYVGGSFNCSDNFLISLQYAPKGVRGYFWCTSNNLLSDIVLSKIGLVFFIKGGNTFSVTDSVISSIKRMTHEQQMKELNFFDEHDANASRMFQEVLIDLGVDFGTHRKEMLDRVKGNDNLKALGL